MTDEERDLGREVRELRSAVAALEERLSSVERHLERPHGERGVEPEGADETGTDRPLAEAAGQPTIEHPPDDGTRGTGNEASSDAATRASERDWELDVGIRWLGVVGVLALLVGVGLFVRYAIQQDLLGYAARIVLGVCGGATLVGIGRYAARYDRYERWGRIVIGGGLAITALSLYASYGFDAYREAIGTTLGGTVALLSVVVAAGVWISLRDERPFVGGESFLIGYLTAAITIPDWGGGTLAYALVLTVAIAAVAADRDRPALAVGGALGSYGVYAYWWSETGGSTIAAAGFLVVTFACLLAVAMRPLDRQRTELAEWSPDALVAVNALAFAFAIDALLIARVAGLRSSAFLALALVFGALTAVSERPELRPTPPAPYLAVGSGLLAIDLALSPFWVTIVLAGALPVLLAGALRLDRPHPQLAVHGVAAVLVTKVAMADATELAPVAFGSGAVPTRLIAFLAAVVACYGTALLLDRRPGSTRLSDIDRRLPTVLPAAYAWAGTGLATLLIALELSSYPLSVAWAGYALAILAVGLVVGVRSLRLQGVAVLGLTTLKVFFLDLSGLEPLPRTLSFLTLGIVLLVAAFAYARNAGRIAEAV